MSNPETAPRRRRGRALGVTATVVLVLVAVGGGGFVYGTAQAQGPINAAKAYCTDLKTKDYAAAYGLLSTNYQSHITQADYVTDAKLHDQVDGAVSDCGQPHTGTFTWNLGESPQSLQVAITRQNVKPQLVGALTLAKQGDNWKIDAIADSLKGTDFGAYHVAEEFCTNFLAANYAAAYQLFSANGQQNYGSEQQFETAFKGTFSNGISLAQCVPDITTYTVTAPSAQINLKLSITVTTSVGSTTFPLPNGATLKFVQQSGTWKVDMLNLNIANA